MEEIDSSPPATNPLKRAAPDEQSPQQKPLNLKGTQFMMPTPPDTDGSSNASPKYEGEDRSREASPAPSISTLSSIEVVSSNPVQSTAATANPTTSASTGPPPTKKRKLTVVEKEQQRKEKEAKAAEKEAEKARKEVEKAQKDAEKAVEKAKKDEEKRIKDEEKRQKAEEREAKKREKELEEERKTQDKLKKQRSQMRLGAFFQKPATPAKESGDGEEFRSARRKSLSLEPFDAVADQIRRSESPCKSVVQPTVTPEPTPLRPTVSDYRKHFLPFQLQKDSFLPDVEARSDPDEAQSTFDHDVNDPLLREKYDLGIVDSYASLERHFQDQRSAARGHQLQSMRQLVDQIQGSIQQPIDLTNDKPSSSPVDGLQSVSRRYLEFSEDVRPAYFGTYTKIRSPRSTKQLRRNPFSRSRKDTDYDYDSEAEWEEPEEGDESLEDDEEEAESVGDAHEMDEFLDDEEDAVKSKRKMITGDLMPTSTGLCWEDESGKIMPSIEGGSPVKTMRGMRMGSLLPCFTGKTIDPFSTSYWESEQKPVESAPVKIELAVMAPDGSMAPPRPPLQPRPNSNGTLDSMFKGSDATQAPTSSTASTQGAKTSRRPAPKPLSKEDLEEFKMAVIGSQLTKADLTKDLKARFPKITNDAIKSTLGDHFAQVGAKQADKKWVFVSA